VHPCQYRAAISALSFYELRPYHVVFSESLGYLLEETLAHYKGSWMTTCAPVHERIASASQVGATSDAESVECEQGQMLGDITHSSEQDRQWVMCVQRTFVCLAHRCASLETHVTSSTTDAHCSSLTNPRIVASQREFLWQC